MNLIPLTFTMSNLKDNHTIAKNVYITPLYTCRNQVKKYYFICLCNCLAIKMLQDCMRKGA